MAITYINIKDLISNSIIWKNELNQCWCRRCPKCYKIIKHTGKYSKRSAGRFHLQNRCCNCCKRLGTHHTIETKNKIKNRNKKYYSIKENNWWYGKKHTEEQKRKISEGNRGKIRSDEIKKKFSLLRKGKKLSEETKQLLSINSPKFWLGKKLSEESKQNMRIAKLKRLEKLGIPACIDKGAPIWFEKYNAVTNSNLQPKRFLEIGYDADGYDEEKHIWMEYDTPYHNRLQQQKKDLIRQNNIIKYFESINIPLQEFIRVKDDGRGNVKLKSVYKRK